MFNDSLSSEYEVKKLIQDNQDRRTASETQIDLCKYLQTNLNRPCIAVMAGLIEKDITTPYNFAKFQNQNAEVTKLQAFERANFGCF